MCKTVNNIKKKINEVRIKQEVNKLKKNRKPVL